MSVHKGDRHQSKVEFDNTYYKIHDEGVMSEYDIRNNYKSWRNNITKDHNVYQDTIDSMDKLYDDLFPVREVYIRPTREELIKESFKDKETRECLKKTTLSF